MKLDSPPATAPRPSRKPKPDKKAKQKTPQQPVMAMTAAGFAGGLAGAGVWIVIGMTGYEIGWIAWLVGAAVGAGVRMFNPNNSEVGGAIAVPIAMGMILLGKWGSYMFLSIPGMTFGDMFSFYDVLWFLLAAATAAGLAFIGAGEGEIDE